MVEFPSLFIVNGAVISVIADVAERVGTILSTGVTGSVVGVVGFSGVVWFYGVFSFVNIDGSKK